MRKLLLCVLMTLALTACAGGGNSISAAEEEALAIRAECLETNSCAVKATLTADYGQRVYRYELDASLSGEECVLTLTAPETLAGLTARVTGKDGQLEFDGLALETGPLDGENLTPMSALPALLEAARSGFLTTCCFETLDGVETVRMDCGDPEERSGEGTQLSIWFDRAEHTPVQGEILVDGLRVILCEFSEFTKA